MKFLTSIPGFFIPTVQAMGLADIGGGMVTGMWIDVCTILPYCGQGASGIAIVTGIIVKATLWVIGSGAVVMILLAAVRLVTSNGNEEVITKAKKMILYAALGLVFAVLASVIVNTIFSFVAGIATAV